MEMKMEMKMKMKMKREMKMKSVEASLSTMRLPLHHRATVLPTVPRPPTPSAVSAQSG